MLLMRPRMTHRSAERDVEVERGSAILPPNDEETDTLSGADRDRRRVVDEVLIATDAVAGVLGQGANDVVLRADASGDRDVALHERHPPRNPETKGDRKDAQDPTEHDYEQDPAAAGAATDTARSLAPPGLLAVHPRAGSAGTRVAVGHEVGSVHRP